jgi:hypothetical protein
MRTKIPALEPVAELAGYPLSESDLAEVADVLGSMMEEIQKLRDLELPDEIEPVTVFLLEPWD